MKRKAFNWALPPEIESRLGEGSYGRQRAIAGGGFLLIILHAPPASGSHDRDAVVFLRSPEGRLQVNGQDGGELRLRRLLAEYRELLGRLDQQCDEAVTADQLFPVLESLMPLNRTTTHLADALQSARDLAREDRFLIGMRDEAYEISRGYDLLTADARLKLECRMARNAELNATAAARATHAQHKLNVLAACTLPVTALATLLGMNVVHGLEQRTPLLFWVVLLFGFGVGFAVKGWVVRGPGAGRD
jgi:hypothetical protein